MIVIDDFIKDKNLLKEIDESEDFWKFGYSWWSGWKDTPATTLRHKLIEYIYRYNPWLSMNIKGYGQGFEHWVGIQTPDTEQPNTWGKKWALAPHQDKDEDFWENHPTGRNRGDSIESMRFPLLGTVFYTQAPEEGGYLQIWNTWDINEVSTNPDVRNSYQLIKPKRNRLVIFNAGHLHAVQSVKKGTRKAIAINLWDPKPITKMEEE